MAKVSLWDIKLDDLLTELRNQKIIISNEYTAYYKLKSFGNEAVHPKLLDENVKPYHYDDDELVVILDYFNQTMRFLNDRAVGKKLT